MRGFVWTTVAGTAVAVAFLAVGALNPDRATASPIADVNRGDPDIGSLGSPGSTEADASRAAVDPVGPVEALTGEVITSRARWTADRRRIVTESVIRTDGGAEVALVQSGGSVDGIGMIQYPAPPVLRRGDVATVIVPAATARAASGALLPRRIAEVTDLIRAPLANKLGDDRSATQTTNDVNAGLFWASGCVFITPDEAGTVHLPADTELDVIADVARTWNDAIPSCSFFEIQVDAPSSQEVGFDRINTIKFRDDRWCRPASGDESEECYAAQAAGITTLFFIEDAENDRNGEILDGDIELNAVNFTISDDGATDGPQNLCFSDLRNTLTHEIGHLLGLDHTCFDGVGGRPVDINGEPVPSCGLGAGLPPEITEATMFNFQDCGETKKGSPEQDDISGICAIYPIADDPGSCERVAEPGQRGGCGCATSGASGDPLAPLWMLLALGAAVFIRRRRS